MFSEGVRPAYKLKFNTLGLLRAVRETQTVNFQQMQDFVQKAPVNNCLALGHDEMDILYSVLKNKILQRPFLYIFLVLVGKIFS